MGNGHLSAWFLLHYYNFGLRNGDCGLKNPNSKIRIPKYLYLKFGIGQSPDEKWDSGVSIPLISPLATKALATVAHPK
jgi:hypothetical protein